MVQLFTWISRPASRRLLAGMIAVVGMVATVCPLMAQDYKALPRKFKSEREVNDVRKTALSALKGGSSFAQAEAPMRKYYEDFVATEMSQLGSKANGAQFPEWRREIQKDIFDAARYSGGAQKQDGLRKLVYEVFTKLFAAKDRTPACRYNALLILGDLNDREQARRGSTIEPPVPSSRVRDLLLKTYKDSSEPEIIHIGAMIGLVRHNKMLAAAGSPDASLVSLFRQALAKSEPAAGETAEGVEWMRLLAIDALGDAGMTEDAASLTAIVADENEAIMLRSAAMSALSRLSYQANADIDEGAVIKAAGLLTTKLLETQVAETKSYIDNNADEIRSAQRLIGLETSGNDNKAAANTPENPYVARVRKETMYRLISAYTLVKGITPAVTEPTWQTARESLQRELVTILKSLDTTALQPQEFYDKLAPIPGRLSNILNSAA
ncbi:MAG: hypothetical protein KDA92_10010 [Planctomycetales bacterium]|nr:hypothetical protein [Planctomycetales bacterium]MCA9168815.1 hypothetical protein [Planctomycetales bacterium]